MKASIDMEELEEQQKPNHLKVFFRDVITILIIAGVMILGLQAVVQKFIVEGPSMNYTLENGQQLLVNKFVYNLHEPERGDIIVFHPPFDIDTDDYIKRIIGLPGEVISIEDGIVTIQKTDGTTIVLDEPYVKNQSSRGIEPEMIPADHYFVMGDNRNNSSDSRNGWTLQEENIIGKAWLSIWPPSDWGLIQNHDFEDEGG